VTLQTVDYGSADPNAQTIDWVRVIRPDGSVERFIASDQVTMPDDATPDLEHLQQAEPARRMDCLDCHNRVGHPLPSPRREVDLAMSDGRIDATLPQVKAQAMAILTAGYPTLGAADAAAASLRDFYRLRYPEVADARTVAIDDAVTEVQLIYRLAATPEMKVTALTYPDNLGHTDFPGCFRCHDGRHVSTKGKVLSTECSVCHTMPERGPLMPLGTISSDRKLPWHPVELQGKHARILCNQCHSAGYRPPSECAECHKMDTAAPMMSMACTDCHQKVGEAKPLTSCRECHDTLPGLHKKGGHPDSACTDCHKPHTWKVTGRDRCLECHSDMKEHNAPKPCTECHDFRKGRSAKN